MPPGGCIRDFGTPCDSDPNDGRNPCGSEPCTCASGQFCQPSLSQAGSGTCRAQVQDFCTGAQDCPVDTVCVPRGQDVQRLVDPLADRDRGTVFTGSGHCIERRGSCATTDACEPGETCRDGACEREHAVCQSDAQCPAPSVCRLDLLAQTLSDRDDDEIPDHLDNCPEVSNPLQSDADSDGLGDACDSCTQVLDGKMRVKVGVNRGLGRVAAAATLPVLAYAEDSATLSVLDGGLEIASQTVGILPPKRIGKVWEFRADAPGVRRLRLVNQAPRTVGQFRFRAKASRWFDPALLSRDPTVPARVRLRLGASCFELAAIKLFPR